MLRKGWSNYEVTANEAEEMEAAYIVFEEYADKKNYDLTKGIFTSLEVAKEYAEELNKDADDSTHNYVTLYKDYSAGNYNYM